MFRLIWKFFNTSPSETKSFFKGQVLIGKANHFLLYVSIFTITISGILKKLYMGETLNFIFFKYGFKKDNFILADAYYDVHVYANYLLLALAYISLTQEKFCKILMNEKRAALHVFAVIAHHFIFKDKILKKIL